MPGTSGPLHPLHGINLPFASRHTGSGAGMTGGADSSKKGSNSSEKSTKTSISSKSLPNQPQQRYQYLSYQPQPQLLLQQPQILQQQQQQKQGQQHDKGGGLLTARKQNNNAGRMFLGNNEVAHQGKGQGQGQEEPDAGTKLWKNTAALDEARSTEK
ncbi:RNA polymerase II degradation factor 1-like [Aplysia californica]|uniref:RNA polymerase II degradation factor 1-like n=1 Tax=Aplysia californica TaxID=6500 RepID=A0ABM1A132_APLCA|nr:RNA polymerase II degradation factor 1-like [Aplysia californica]